MERPFEPRYPEVADEADRGARDVDCCWASVVMRALYRPVEEALSLESLRRVSGNSRVHRIPSTWIVRPGELFDPGDCGGSAVVESGALLVEFVTLSGMELLLHRLEVDDQIVDLGAVGNPAYAICYRAEKPTRVKEQPGSITDRNLVTHLLDKVLNSAFRVIHELSCLQASHRLYCELLRMDAAAKRRGTDECPLPTQSVLATRLGAARETVARELSFLRRRNIISSGANLKIVDMPFMLHKLGNALQLPGEEHVRAAIGL